MLVALGACGGGGGGDGASAGVSGGASGQVSGSDGSVSGDSNTATKVPAATQPVVSSPSVPVGASGGAVAGDVVDSSGKIDPTAYRAMASKMSAADGITYRYGSASTAARATKTWHERANTKQIYSAEKSEWQVGGPEVGDPGDYFYNAGNAVFVADTTARVGVADIQLLGQSFNTFIQRPQQAWIGSNPDVNNFDGLDDDNALTIGARNPVAAARCYGRSGWCLEAVVAYQDGLLATAIQSNQAQNRASVRLPANKVPTAIAQTNSAEFALVTVWDTVALKGQIAVVALAGLCNGCSPAQAGSADYWGEWGAVHPGLANLGNTGFMKVLGYVDLPEGMRAPTDIVATTGLNAWQGVLDTAGTPNSAFKMPLAVEANRQTFISGNNTGAYSKAGVAIVVSKSEKRATFVDLKPLFAYYKRMYFGTRADFDKTTTVGMADNQWPYAFTQMADSDKPRVIQTLDLGARPTAVKASMTGANMRGWIATQEGNLRLFDLGGYGDGSGAGTIKQVGSVAVGANPTSIAYFRGGSDSLEQKGIMDPNFVMVLSRDERAVKWVDFTADHNSGTVRTNVLTDSRLVDPVMIEDNENHGTEGWVLSIADYGGKAIRNYRYGSVIFYTNVGAGMACAPPTGCGLGPQNLPPSQYPFEYGGAMPLPGKPFIVTGGNVP